MTPHEVSRLEDQGTAFAEIVDVREFLADELDNRLAAGDSAYVREARKAQAQFEKIVRAYRALKSENV